MKWTSVAASAVAIILVVGSSRAQQPARWVATYVVNEKRITNYDSRIDFYGRHSGSYLYSSKFHGPTSGMEEGFGGSFTVVSNESAYYVPRYPITVPKGAARQWVTDKYLCHGEPSGMQIAVRCVSIATGSAFRSIFDPKKGIVALDFFCGPFSNEICRYDLISDEGLLGPLTTKMLSKRE